MSESGLPIPLTWVLDKDVFIYRDGNRLYAVDLSVPDEPFLLLDLAPFGGSDEDPLWVYVSVVRLHEIRRCGSLAVWSVARRMVLMGVVMTPTGFRGTSTMKLGTLILIVAGVWTVLQPRTNQAGELTMV
jgi:hypothetical protein